MRLLRSCMMAPGPSCTPPTRTSRCNHRVGLSRRVAGGYVKHRPSGLEGGYSSERLDQLDDGMRLSLLCGRGPATLSLMMEHAVVGMNK